MTRLRTLASLTIPLLTAPLAAQERIEFDDYSLDNGLRIILVEDHSAPVVTVDLWYDVGSSSERLNRTGFAHLFEHMMFEGSANVGKAEHMALIERAGGSMNGTTNEDRTAYFETVPANRLNLALWLEADRMRSLAVTDENFENQRNAVQEERRMRIDNQPYAAAFVEGITQLFDSTDCFGYAHSVIGSMDDLNRAQTVDVQSFFDLYYAPGNATLVLVGDFDPTEAKSLIEQYYGDIPAGEEPPATRCAWSVGTEAQQIVWDDPLANLPLVLVAYRTPAHGDGDIRALQLLSEILGAGESSRLNRKMVREEQSAVQAGTQVDSRQMASVFIALGIANQGVEAQVLADQLHAEVARVLAEGITEEELTKAKNAYRSRDIFGRQTTMAVAQNIQHYLHYHKSLDEFYTDLDMYMAVTADDIQRFAQKYLTPENSFTILVTPKAATQAPVP